jgi:plastocyanin
MSRLMLVGILFVAAAISSPGETVTAHFTFAHGQKKSKAKNAPEVVVWLTPTNGPAQPVAAHPSHPFRLMQKNKSFIPHILVVPAGSVVEFPNRDSFFHNVFSLFEGKRFDLGLYEAGTSRLVHFDRPGISYVFCNIHSEMSAVVVVTDSRYYGKSDAEGNVSITDVPAGRYVLHVWSERSSPAELQALTRTVTISATSASIGNIHLRETPHVQLAHKNKYGEEYEPPAPSSPIYIQP